MTPLEALQATLAGEHAAIYVYGVLGGRVSASAAPDLASRLYAGYVTHRGRRDQLIAMVRDAGAEPVAAHVGYRLPNRAVTARQLTDAAPATEDGCARVYADMVGSTSRANRQFAIDALTDTAVRELGFGGAAEAFPGIAELERLRRTCAGPSPSAGRVVTTGRPWRAESGADPDHFAGATPSTRRFGPPGSAARRGRGRARRRRRAARPPRVAAGAVLDLDHAVGQAPADHDDGRHAQQLGVLELHPGRRPWAVVESTSSPRRSSSAASRSAASSTASSLPVADEVHVDGRDLARPAAGRSRRGCPRRSPRRPGRRRCRRSPW